MEILKELRIKTSPAGTRSTAARLRSSPFLAQLLRTAPALSPATSLPSPADPPSRHTTAAAKTGGLALHGASARQGAESGPPFSPSSGAGVHPSTGSPESLATSSPMPVPARAVATASMESAGSNSPMASGLHTNADTACATPVLSESAAESAIRQALVQLASNEKVIRFMSPVDLDAPAGSNPHAAFAASAGSLPKFTLAALDSPPAASITRQSSGSVNGPDASAASPVGHAKVVPIQDVVGPLLNSPKLAVMGGDSPQNDKTPYQTLLQHLMGSGQAAAHSPGSQPSCPKAAANSPQVEQTPAMFRPRAVPLMHPVVQATPARHRSAC